MILKRQLYSEYYYFEQREYGIGSKILKAGKNKLAKIVSNLQKSTEKKSENLKNLVRDLEKNEIKNKRLTDNLIKEANRRNIGVFGNGELNSGMNTLKRERSKLENARKIRDGKASEVAKRNKLLKEQERLGKIVPKEQDPENTEILFFKDFKNSDKHWNDDIEKIKKSKSYKFDKSFKKVVDSLNDNDAIINFKGREIGPAGTLAHELGHFDNRTKLKNRIITKLANKFKKEKATEETIKNSGLGSALGRRIFQPIEEKNAWKNGKQLMKKGGASKEELRKYEERTRAEVRSYKTEGNKEILDKIANKLKQGKEN